MHFFLILLLVLSTAAFADSPPAFQPFEAKSSNGLYVAKGFAENEGEKINPWELRYKLRVSETSGMKRMLWEVKYDFDGYQGGQPSNDGQYFVYINFWFFEDSSVISIYTKIQAWKISGKDLGINAEKLQRTASHKLWLTEGTRFDPEVGAPSALIINTVQGPRRIELRPNPSLKLSTNGVSRWPSSAGPAAHFALAVQRATPLAPA